MGELGAAKTEDAAAVKQQLAAAGWAPSADEAAPICNAESHVTASIAQKKRLLLSDKAS